MVSMEDINWDAMQVARRVAGYYIGDPDWAELIVRAYLNPVTAAQSLRDETSVA